MKIKPKQILPILLGLISFYISVLFFFGAMAGYIFANFFSKKVKPIKFSWGSYKIHLHHWLFFLWGLVVVLMTGVYYFIPSFALGFAGGHVFQGIYCYNDWYKILEKEKI